MSSRYPPLQRYLGWLQRFLFQVEIGEFPFPQPVIEIGYDWPFTLLNSSISYTTAVGDTNTEVYAPAQGKHGIVRFFTVVNNAGAIPAGDTLQLLYNRNPAVDPNLVLARWIQTAAVLDMVSLVGGSVGAQAASGGFVFTGVAPVYVPEGYRLALSHGSVAGGVAMTGRFQVFERDQFLPLRIP